MKAYKTLIILLILLMTSCSSTPRNEVKSEQESIKNEVKAIEESKAINFSSEAGKTEHLSLEIKSIVYTSSSMVINYSIQNSSDEEIWVCVQSNTRGGDKPSRLNYEADIFENKVEINLTSPHITEYLETPIYSKFRRVGHNRTEEFELAIIMPIVQLTTKTGSYKSDDKKIVRNVNEIKEISFSIGYYLNLKKASCVGKEYCDIIYSWRMENHEATLKVEILLINND